MRDLQYRSASDIYQYEKWGRFFDTIIVMRDLQYRSASDIYQYEKCRRFFEELSIWPTEQNGQNTRGP